VEVFHYMEGPEPAVLVWSGYSDAGSLAVPPAKGTQSGGGDESLRALNDQKAAEEARLSFEAGRARGMQEGSQMEREATAAARMAEEKRRAEQVAELVQRFAEDRERTLHAVEHEVVALALAVAARILRREAQMDPLLLTGAVRVALGQLSNSTEVKLRVPAADLDLWSEAIAHVPNLTVKPAVVADEGMRLGDCIVETTVGSVDLGIRAQMAEIEHGFFDRAVRATPRAVSGGVPDPHNPQEAHA
ncbi:MAG TPA: FliH/SctL family protein, partial [Terracidiphilus sp.]|nr:FliH/SctL family protein [Terracidiphilus sp.]